MKRSQPKLNLSGLLILVIILFTTEMVASQAAHNRSILPFVTKNNDLFGMAKTFITNIGQYDDIPKGYTQEKILFGYEGMGGMILFTKKGIVQVQRKQLDETESSELRGAREKEKQKNKESEEREKWMQVQKVITMEWKGANSNVQIIAEEPTVHHYTYNLNSKMAKGYGRIV